MKIHFPSGNQTLNRRITDAALCKNAVHFGAQACNYKCNRLWVRFPPEEIKYLIFSSLRSGVEAKFNTQMPLKFAGKYFNTRFPLPTMPRAIYTIQREAEKRKLKSLKLKNLKQTPCIYN